MVHESAFQSYLENTEDVAFEARFELARMA